MENSVKLSKRIWAYLLDIVVVYVLILLIINIKAINPTYEKYQKYYQNYLDTVDKYAKNEITIEEMTKINNDNIYYVTKYSVSYNIVAIVVIIGYYVFFQKYNNGQTIGKKIMKIKVVNTDNKDVSIRCYLLRNIIMYYVFVGNMTALLANGVAVCLFSKNIFSHVSVIVTCIFFGLNIASLLIMIMRQDGLGIHDKIARTKVVYEEV